MKTLKLQSHSHNFYSSVLNFSKITNYKIHENRIRMNINQTRCIEVYPVSQNDNYFHEAKRTRHVTGEI